MNDSASRGGAVIVPKHPAQPVPTFNGAGLTADFFASVDQSISQALVVPFVVIIEFVRRQRPPQHSLAEEGQPIQTLAS